MSTLVAEQPALEAAPRLPRAETLAASVIIMLMMTVAQRLIGFGRGVMFCRWLSAEELGQWDVAMAFLNLAAPLAVLGLPSSFGRYVEYFRARGQFHTFLRRTTLVAALAAVLATALVFVARTWFAQLIFGTGERADVVVWLAVCLAAIILHNFLTALFIAVRTYRIVTLLQFLQSLGFAVFSLALLVVFPLGARSVVIGFAVATGLSCLAAIGWLVRLTTAEADAAAPLAPRSFWAKLAPFAAWMWVTNLVGSLFELIDRYMIVHHGGMTASEAMSQVGNYHTSRIVPLLFVAVAGLLASLMTPHLAQDWEVGRRRSVVRRLNLTLKILSLSLLGASIFVLFSAPLLFGVAFQNKFQGGLAVLPCTLAYGAWFGTFAVAVNYLWCAERASLASLPLVFGLLLNIGLNLVLLPRYGLSGAVWATTIANLAALMLVYRFSSASGMRVDRGTWLISLAIGALCFGPWVALAVFAIIVRRALVGHRLFTRREKLELAASLAQGIRKLGDIRRRLGAAVTVAQSPR